MQQHDASALLAREALEAPEEIDLFACIELLAEAAEGAERRHFAEHEGARGPFQQAAYPIPHGYRETHVEARILVAHGGAAREAVAAFDRLRRLVEERDARPRIGVDEDEPVAARARGAGIARAGDLIYRLEHHDSARGARDRRRGVGGIVFAGG